MARVIKLDFHLDLVGYRLGDITGHHLYRPGALFGYQRYVNNTKFYEIIYKKKFNAHLVSQILNQVD